MNLSEKIDPVPIQTAKAITVTAIEPLGKALPDQVLKDVLTIRPIVAEYRRCRIEKEGGEDGSNALATEKRIAAHLASHVFKNLPEIVTAMRAEEALKRGVRAPDVQFESAAAFMDAALRAATSALPLGQRDRWAKVKAASQDVGQLIDEIFAQSEVLTNATVEDVLNEVILRLSPTVGLNLVTEINIHRKENAPVDFFQLLASASSLERQFMKPQVSEFSSHGGKPAQQGTRGGPRLSDNPDFWTWKKIRPMSQRYFNHNSPYGEPCDSCGMPKKIHVGDKPCEFVRCKTCYGPHRPGEDCHVRCTKCTYFHPPKGACVIRKAHGGRG